jgi:hypothetical protein
MLSNRDWQNTGDKLRIVIRGHTNILPVRGDRVVHDQVRECVWLSVSHSASKCAGGKFTVRLDKPGKREEASGEGELHLAIERATRRVRPKCLGRVL